MPSAQDSCWEARVWGLSQGASTGGLLIENSLESENAHVYVDGRGEMILFILLNSNSKITPLQNR